MSTTYPGIGWRTPLVVIAAGCVISLIGFGVRSTMGLFLDPMTVARGWDRETFALAMALQNLLWGVAMPVAGALADRFGSRAVIGLGAVVYAAGVWGMAESTSNLAFHLTAGILTGTGVALTSFSLALAVMVRAVGPERRSFTLGLGTAAGSLGQVIFSPVSQAFISSYGWHDTLFILSACALVLLPLAWFLPGGGPHGNAQGAIEQTLGQALREATSHRGYLLLTSGFFVCGFHVAFIAVHFPAYVRDIGLDPSVGAYALAVVGLFNIVGSFIAGAAGARWSKKVSLSFIYFARAVCITALLFAPATELTIYTFAAVMGLLWLSTVPLTTAIVAQVFGVRFMATLFGIVFFSHQIGSFLGVWLGGWIYDVSGSYEPMWWAGVFFGVLAAIIHLPIDERPREQWLDARGLPPPSGAATGTGLPAMVIALGLLLIITSLAIGAR